MNVLSQTIINAAFNDVSLNLNEILESFFKNPITESVGGLDVSIDHLKKKITNPAKAAEFITKTLRVEEKIDGTKIIIVRNDQDSKNYWENWIVAYKGNVLYPEEFIHLTDKDKEEVRTHAISISQYSFVFDKLKTVNALSIPKNTAFSMEFAQNKETLTRTYRVRQGIFLRSFAPVKYFINKGFLTTSVIGTEVTDRKAINVMAKKLNVFTFPVWLEGKIDTPGNFEAALLENGIPRNKAFYDLYKSTVATINFSDPLNVVSNFSNMVLKIESSLGGDVAEGVVISTSDGKLYKVTQEDQYNVDVRNVKKDLYRMDPEKEAVYTATIREISKKLIGQLNTDQPLNSVLGEYNALIKKVNLDKIEHEKKSSINKLDDLMLIGKFIIQQRLFIGIGTKTLGVVPMAGKPVHLGHWKLIEIASKENEKVLVYVSNKGRLKKGEYPIGGEQMIEVWNEILNKYLPKNVSIKFVDSPVSNIRYLMLDLNSDPEDAPVTTVYSDTEDIQNYDPTEFNSKYVGIGSLGKIKFKGVNRSQTVDISGTKMRSFLQDNDKSSFLNYLPPISMGDKEKIWSLFHKEQLTEGGWRSADTQSTIVNPLLVEKAVSIFEQFLTEFNAYSTFPPLKFNGPVGSASYYKDDLNDPSVTYGDIDLQVVYPVNVNDRRAQLETGKIYADKIRQFIQDKHPPYIFPNLDDRDFGVSYLILIINGEKVQLDLVKSYTVTAGWVKTRTTPEKGLKGFVTGLLLSALSETLNVSIGSNANPHFNVLNGEIVSGPLRKGTVQHYLNPKEVYLDLVKYYAKLAGIENVDSSKLEGHFGLSETDPHFKRKCEDVVALANTLDVNKIFETGVIKSKDGMIIKSRVEFVDKIKGIFFKMMDQAKTAKKFEKATTPQAFATIEKVKAHADKGIDMVTQIINEIVDRETVKLFNNF